MRATYVRPSGSFNSKIAIVGEQPGKMEVKIGIPFRGPAGQELRDNLRIASIISDDCYFTNVIKDLDKPLSSYITYNKGRITVQPEGQEYIDELQNELKNFKGIIVPCGWAALYALCNRTGINKWRGSIIESTLCPEVICVPCLHPATVIPPKNQFLNRILIQYDLAKAKRISEQGFRPPRLDLRVAHTATQAIEFIADCHYRGKRGAIIWFDIETPISNIGKEVLCFALGYNLETALCVPLVSYRGDYFSPEDEYKITIRLASLLEDEDVRIGGQNLIFDTNFMFRKYGIRIENGLKLHDTMIAQQIMLQDFPKGLDFITSIQTDFPYYKQEGKDFMKSGGSWENFWKYNAMDIVAPATAFKKQRAQLIKQNNLETYDRQRKLLPILNYMMERGIEVDVEGMKAESIQLSKDIDINQVELDKIVGRPMNVASHKQMTTYFYIDKGVKPYKSKGKISCDDTVLKRLIRRGFKEAQVAQTIRKLQKLKGTYLPLDDEGNLTKVDSDGRMRCSYNPVGTKFSRLSSAKTIFDTGMDMQNWPHKQLRHFKADDGYVIYTIDEAQAENRIVAYAGQVRPMIDAFESGQDVHMLTAALIYQKPVEEISRGAGTSRINPEKSERDDGKAANHGFNYDWGYKAFALKHEIPERQGKFIYEGYHSVYPGVKQFYHPYIRKCLSKNRMITNLMGRNTLFLDRWGDKLFKSAYSCIPQGTVGDVINERGLEFIWYNEDKLFDSVEILIQVHDSIGFQIPLSIPLKQHAKIILKIRDSLEQPLKIHGQTFVIPIDLTIGFNLYKEDCKEIKWKSFPTEVDELAIKLDNIIEGLKDELVKE